MFKKTRSVLDDRKIFTGYNLISTSYSVIWEMIVLSFCKEMKVNEWRKRR